jgi:signal transduction histidine kinase
MCGAAASYYRRAMRVPLMERLRPGHWLALDAVGALLVVAVWLPALLNGHSDAGPAVRFTAFVGLLGATVLAVPLAMRRRYPVAACWLAVPAFGLSLATTVIPVVPLASVPMALVAYSIAATRRRAAFVGLAAIVLVITAATTVWTGQWAWPRLTVLLPGMIVITGWLFGRMAGQYRAYAESLRAQRDRAADARVRATVADERLRIARELHDVVAHSMSVITIQADMGRLMLETKPAAAGAALGAIETTGRDALVEMRRMLGVLREDGDPTREALGPAPGLRELDRLVAHTATAGVDVTLVVTGRPRPLPAGVDLSAYRIVQESLTNVVKHAGASTCAVTIGYEREAVTIEIIDGGRGGQVRSGGHGLVGMRERAGLCGGEFDAGPLPDKGFRVSVRLPSTT